MKLRKFMFVCTAAIFLVAACTDEKEEPVEPQGGGEEVVYDEAWYAANATWESSDPSFVLTDEGGSIYFAAEGGEVSVAIDCGVDWTAENSAKDIFDMTYNSSGVTVTAAQNVDDEVKTATITLLTLASRITFATISVEQEAYTTPAFTLSGTECHFPAVGELTTEIEVSSTTGDYEMECSCEWLTVEKTSAGISLAALENEETLQREAEIVLTTTDGINTSSQTISVVQDAKVYLSLSSAGIAFYENGDSPVPYVTIDSNFDWELSYDSSDDWYSITTNDNVVTVSVADYTEDDYRYGYVTVIAGDGAENTTRSSFRISQCGVLEDALILVYDITDPSVAARLPLSGGPSCTVDWGDGSGIANVTSGWPSYVYSVAAKYEIKVRGKVTGLNSMSASSTIAEPLKAIKQWGETGLTSMSGAFYRCVNLESLPEVTGDALANVTTFSECFRFCSALTKLPSDFLANSTKVTDLSNFLDNCTALEEIPAGLFDSCTQNKTFFRAFNGCKSIKSLPDGLFDKCTEVTSFQQCFQSCSELTEIPENLFANNKKVTDFYSTFYNCGEQLTGESAYDLLDIDGVPTKVHLYERMDDAYKSYYPDVSSISSSYCYTYDTGLADYSAIPLSWGGEGD